MKFLIKCFLLIVFTVTIGLAADITKAKAKALSSHAAHHPILNLSPPPPPPPPPPPNSPPPPPPPPPPN